MPPFCSMRRVALQLDYHMSTQFAGVAVALQRGLLAAAGLDLTIMPTCPPGEEPTRVARAHQNAMDAGDQLTVLGSAEQNVLIPDLKQNGTPVSAVAAMFSTSPLALAALPGTSLKVMPAAGSSAGSSSSPMRIGAHVDTVDLLQRLVPHAAVVAVSREDKLQLLRHGEIDAVQVYDVMETLRLHDDLGEEPVIVKFSELMGADGTPELGYSQVLFAHDDALSCSEQRDDIRKLCEAIFEGWALAIEDPEAAARDVAALVPRGKLGELEGAGHWRNSHEFLTKSVIGCCEYVKRTRRGNKLGTIDSARWQRANDWLQQTPSESESVADLSSPHHDFGLDRTGAYSLDSRWMPGHDVAAVLSKKIQRDAAELQRSLGGRRPSLLVISVGTTALGRGHVEAERRLSLSAANASWYSKTQTGEAHGINVTELQLPTETTTKQLMQMLHGLRIGGEGGFVGDSGDTIYDGVQLMWPLPKHIDGRAAFSAIPREIDADGAHWLGDMHLASQRHRERVADGPPAPPAHLMPPATPAAVLELLAHYGVPIRGERALVVGRSRIVGQPLAHALGLTGATVTVAHSDTSNEDLKQAVGCADLVISCAGVPGIISADWLRDGATAISVGSALDKNGNVLSDIEDLENSATAGRFATAPGGVGPIAVLKLFENVLAAARAATHRAAARPIGATEETPTLTNESLQAALSAGTAVEAWNLDDDGRLMKKFWLPSYPCAVSFVKCVSDAAEELNHHPDSLAIDHRCVDGVDVSIGLCTLSSSGGLTEFDLELARSITDAYDGMLVLPSVPSSAGDAAFLVPGK